MATRRAEFRGDLQLFHVAAGWPGIARIPPHFVASFTRRRRVSRANEYRKIEARRRWSSGACRERAKSSLLVDTCEPVCGSGVASRWRPPSWRRFVDSSSGVEIVGGPRRTNYLSPWPSSLARDIRLTDRERARALIGVAQFFSSLAASEVRDAGRCPGVRSAIFLGPRYSEVPDGRGVTEGGDRQARSSYSSSGAALQSDCVQCSDAHSRERNHGHSCKWSDVWVQWCASVL